MQNLFSCVITLFSKQNYIFIDEDADYDDDDDLDAMSKTISNVYN